MFNNEEIFAYISILGEPIKLNLVAIVAFIYDILYFFSLIDTATFFIYLLSTAYILGKFGEKNEKYTTIIEMLSIAPKLEIKH